MCSLKSTALCACSAFLRLRISVVAQANSTAGSFFLLFCVHHCSIDSSPTSDLYIHYSRVRRNDKARLLSSWGPFLVHSCYAFPLRLWTRFCAEESIVLSLRDTSANIEGCERLAARGCKLCDITNSNILQEPAAWVVPQRAGPGATTWFP